MRGRRAAGIGQALLLMLGSAPTGCGDPVFTGPVTVRVVAPVTGDRILAGDTVLLRAETDAAASATVRIEWTTEWGRVLGHGDSTTAVLTDSGMYEIVAAARTAREVLATAAVPATVLPNHAPTVALEAVPADCRVYITDTVRLAARATDPDSSVVRIEWHTDNAGLVGEGDTLRWIPGRGAEGARIVTARALDPQGNRDDDLAILHVLGGPRFKWARSYPASGPDLNCGGKGAPSFPLALADDGTLRAGLYGSAGPNPGGAVWAIRPTGEPLWAFTTAQSPTEHWAGLVVTPGGRTLFANYDGVMHALSGDGAVLWSLPIIGADWHGRAALAPDGAFYVSGTDPANRGWHALTRIDVESGLVRWTVPRAAACALSSAGVRADGYLSMTCGTWALDVLPDGTVVGVDSLLSPFIYIWYAQSAYDWDGNSYHASFSGGLRMVGPDHTTAWWNWDVKGEEPVIAADGTSYLGAGNAAWRVSPAGDRVWEAALPGADPQGLWHTRLALLADGTLWIGQGRYLIRVRAASGEEIDRVELADAVSSGLVVAPDGTVYVIAGQNRVVAIAGDAPLDPAAPWPVWRRDNRRTSSVRRP